MVYGQWIEEYRLMRISRNLKRSVSSDQDQTRIRKRAQTKEEPMGAKVKLEKGGGSQIDKPTCVTCEKMHYVKILFGYRELLWLCQGRT